MHATHGMIFSTKWTPDEDDDGCTGTCRKVEGILFYFFYLADFLPKCGGAGRCVFCDNHSDERGEERVRGSVCSVEFRVWKVPYWPSSDIFGDFGQGRRGGVVAVGGGGTDKP